MKSPAFISQWNLISVKFLVTDREHLSAACMSLVIYLDYTILEACNPRVSVPLGTIHIIFSKTLAHLLINNKIISEDTPLNFCKLMLLMDINN